jgi:hypothetical protein
MGVTDPSPIHSRDTRALVRRAGQCEDPCVMVAPLALAAWTHGPRTTVLCPLAQYLRKRRDPPLRLATFGSRLSKPIAGSEFQAGPGNGTLVPKDMLAICSPSEHLGVH